MVMRKRLGVLIRRMLISTVILCCVGGLVFAQDGSGSVFVLRESKKVKDESESAKKADLEKRKRAAVDNANKRLRDKGVTPNTVTGGELNSKATVLPRPQYPKNLYGSGSVRVVVAVDDKGNVISAKGLSGPAPLRLVSERAAMGARFNPLILSGVPVQFTGVITYNFVPDPKLVWHLADAAQKGDSARVRLLLDGGVDPNAQNSTGLSPLMYAAGSGRLAVVNALIAKGAEVNARSSSDFSPLMYAASSGHLAVVKALILKGAQIGALDGDSGLTSLSLTKSAPVAQLLVEKGADVNAKTGKLRRTPLMSVKNVSVAEVLIVNGADMNAQDDQGWTPLMVAAFSGQLPIVQLLLSKGASVHAVDNRGNSALTWAKIRKQDAIATILENAQNRPCPANLVSEHLFKLNDRVRTGIRINRNDRVSITASGTMIVGNNARRVGPEGYDSDASEEYERLEGYPLAGVLVTFSERAGWNYVGKGASLTSPVNGTLELAINDNEPETNKGYFDVKLSICRLK